MIENSRSIRIFSIFIVPVMALSCSSSGKAAKQDSSFTSQRNPGNQVKLPHNKMEMIGDSTNPDAAIIPRIKDGIGPDDIRLNARLVRVIAPVPAFTAYPCSRYPCLADIEIIEILARGRTYQGVATQGQVLRAFFPMTLISSDVVFTEKKSLAYPGLSEGSVFQADLTGAASLSEPGEVQHTVISYSIIR